MPQTRGCILLRSRSAVATAPMAVIVALLVTGVAARRAEAVKFIPCGENLKDFKEASPRNLVAEPADWEEYFKTQFGIIESEMATLQLARVCKDGKLVAPLNCRQKPFRGCNPPLRQLTIVAFQFTVDASGRAQAEEERKLAAVERLQREREAEVAEARAKVEREKALREASKAIFDGDYDYTQLLKDIQAGTPRPFLIPLGVYKVPDDLELPFEELLKGCKTTGGQLTEIASHLNDGKGHHLGEVLIRSLVSEHVYLPTNDNLVDVLATSFQAVIDNMNGKYKAIGAGEPVFNYSMFDFFHAHFFPGSGAGKGLGLFHLKEHCIDGPDPRDANWSLYKTRNCSWDAFKRYRNVVWDIASGRITLIDVERIIKNGDAGPQAYNPVNPNEPRSGSPKAKGLIARDLDWSNSSNSDFVLGALGLAVDESEIGPSCQVNYFPEFNGPHAPSHGKMLWVDSGM